MVGIDQSNAAPGWPTAWSTIAWRQAASSELADQRFAAAAQRGIAWLLGVQGELIPHTATTGHDTMIKGWPWVQGTHAWAEPTAMSLLALRHADLANHPRARDAVRLLQDRMLPHGGCNYGNTVVFGQELRPQVQPTGLCLLALAGQRDPRARTVKSIDYLRRELSAQTSTASMCYAVLGLAAHDQLPGNSQLWLDAAAAHRRT